MALYTLLQGRNFPLLKQGIARLLPGQRAMSVASAGTSVAAATVRPLRNITILVVDDDPLTRAELGCALQRDGYSIAEAATSMDCLRLLDAGARFDLLITKVSMPPPHGFALARMARNRNPCQKVLYVDRALNSLPYDECEVVHGPVLRLPIDVAELLDAVERVFESEEA